MYNFIKMSVLFSASLLAGSPVFADDYDWSGSYVVIGMAGAQGETVEGISGQQAYYNSDRKGQVTTLALGHNWVTDKLVFGLEANLVRGSVNLTDPLYPNNRIEQYNELVGKLGAGVGSHLFYGVFGLNSGEVIPNGAALGTAGFSGTTLGLGWDQAVDEDYFVSLRAVRRNQQSADYSNQIQNVTYWASGHVDFVEFRIGRNF